MKRLWHKTQDSKNVFFWMIENRQRMIIKQLTLYKEQSGHFASKLITQAISKIDPSKYVHNSDLLN